MGGSGLTERVTFVLNDHKEQTRGTFMSTGTNELHMEQQKSTLSRGSWAGETRLCGQLNILSLHPMKIKNH